jgi:hypothetical protein
VTAHVISISPGTRLCFDGELVEVTAVDGLRATLRNDRTRQVSSVRICELAAAARPADGAAADRGGSVSPGLILGSLTSEQRAAVTEQAGHVREVLTGFKAGHQDGRGPGEPRPEYHPAKPLKARYQAKADELGITTRTVERWVAAYRESGEAGLADVRTLRGRGASVDPRWDEAVRLVLAEMVSDSTPTRSAVLRKAAARLDELHGAGVVPLPSAATAYRRLGELARGTNAVSGSAKGRRSIADRPKGTYGRLRAMRPGEYAVLDTQDQLTVARLLAGLGLTVTRAPHHLTCGAPAPFLRQLEQQAGLEPGRLTSATLSPLLPPARPGRGPFTRSPWFIRTSGAWYCPACLGERDGRWPGSCRGCSPAPATMSCSPPPAPGAGSHRAAAEVLPPG